jgi:hypothetical protein
VLAVAVVSVLSTLLTSGSVKFNTSDHESIPVKTAYARPTLPNFDVQPLQASSDQVLQLSAGKPAMVEFRLLSNDAHRAQCLTWLPPSSSSSTSNHAVSHGKNNWFKALLSTWGRLLRGLMFWRKHDHHRPTTSKNTRSKAIVLHKQEDGFKRGHQSLAVGMCGQAAAIWSITGYDESAMTITPALYQQDHELTPKCLSIFGPSLATCMLETDGYLNVSMQWILKGNMLAPAVVKSTTIEVQVGKSGNNLPQVKPLAELKMVAVIKSLIMISSASKQGQVKLEEREETFDSIIVM